MNQTRISVCALALSLLFPVSALAGVTLKAINTHSYEKSLYEAAAKQQIENGAPVDKQAFSVKSDNKVLGNILAGQGFNANDDNVCFVSWAAPDGKIQNLVPTIGFDNWEAEVCAGTRAVGVLADDKHSIKLAVIYDAQSPNASAVESVIFSVDTATGTFTPDNALTAKLGSQGAATLQALKTLYRASH
ncbi:hypothetical protein A9B99_06105 [Mangrovibacter phragmitis]|jgi:hypothetical protein|uniref:Uncharacterized protein n=1 Tax=Mangrovibacter phragmitis TaxID=1691903 RepID=A0A1B7L3P2_9ENTR|nr:hypothetical protein [Mangrovibacter phragmitis]OAT76888.1 hypothetical protein A9B99_06105 [Mangrovibacter phragmitis]